MINILYIHGLKRGNSNEESRTAILLRDSLDPQLYQIIAPPFSSDGIVALEQADRIIKERHIDIVVASSLGGFIALLLRGVKKIVINPCIRPDIELLKRATKDTANTYNELVNSLWDNLTVVDKEQTIGVFSNNDELFSYKEHYLKHYSQEIDIEDGHRISEQNIRNVIAPLINKISVF